MKHAYLIMAHNEWDMLNTLLSILDDERNDIFLHIDKKVKVLPELYVCHNSSLHVLTQRFDVHWGDISQVRTEMTLFETANQHGPYAYYHLLSGVDLPIKTQDEIHDFFSINNGKEFVGFFQGEYHDADTWRKVSKYHVLMGWNKRCPFVPKWKMIVGQLIRHILLKIQFAVGYCRPIEMEFKKGHNWTSTTQQFVELLLSQKEFIFKRFDNIQCPDEIYKQTVIWNSPLREKLYNTTDDRLGAMRFIDWNRGEPYAWQDGDEEELLSSPYMFARKISGKQTKLVQAILENAK